MSTNGLLLLGFLQIFVFMNRVICNVEQRQIDVKCIGKDDLPFEEFLYSEKITGLVKCIFSCFEHTDCRTVSYNRASAICHMYPDNTESTRRWSGSLRKVANGEEKMDSRVSGVSTFTSKREQNICNIHLQDVTRSNLHRLDRGESRDKDLNLDPVIYNISLHKACEEGKLCTVQFIMSLRPFDINSRDKQGRTPIMVAALKGQITILDFLLSKNCNLAITDKGKNNILHVACIGGHVDIVKKILLQKKISMDSRGWIGQTPVMTSASYGQRSVFMYLLNYGCKINIRDLHNNNILHVACMGGNVNIVKHIVERLNLGVENKGYKKWTPVMAAVRKGQLDVVQYLVGKGCKLLTKDSEQNNILHLACENGSVAMVKYILSLKKISINSIGRRRLTPVATATVYNHLNVVKYLMSKGCDMTIVTLEGQTALHLACSCGYLNLAKYILSQTNILTERRDSRGNTPLMQAASSGKISTFMFLAKHGSNMQTLDNNNNSILHLACWGCKVYIVKHIVKTHTSMIESKGENGYTPLMTAASRGCQSVFMFLVNRGCNVRVLDVSKRNILHAASIGGNVNIVKYIVEKLKTGIERRDKYGHTPVFWSAYLGQLSVTKYLVGKGCDLTLLDSKGKNVLQLACIGGKDKVMNYLKKLKSWSKTC